jgi:hypothetical protein
MTSFDPASASLRALERTKLAPAETARYSKDLLDSLRKIALQQGQSLLAHLLSLAAQEAKALSESGYAQETRLPE